MKWEYAEVEVPVTEETARNANAQEESGIQEEPKGKSTDSDKDKKANQEESDDDDHEEEKKEKEYPSERDEDNDMSMTRQQLEFALVNLIRKLFTVFSFQIVFCTAIFVDVLGEKLTTEIPGLMRSFCQFIAGILMQMYLNHEVAGAMKMMKYALNHPWKFQYPNLAYAVGFC